MISFPFSFNDFLMHLVKQPCAFPRCPCKEKERYWTAVMARWPEAPPTDPDEYLQLRSEIATCMIEMQLAYACISAHAPSRRDKEAAMHELLAIKSAHCAHAHLQAMEEREAEDEASAPHRFFCEVPPTLSSRSMLGMYPLTAEAESEAITNRQNRLGMRTMKGGKS